MNPEELKEQLRREKERDELSRLNESEKKELRLKRQFLVRHTGNGQYELIGASQEDVEDPEIMKRYDRAIAAHREMSGASNTFSFGV